MDTPTETLIQSFLQQKSYPCVAAIQSFYKKDYQFDHYGKLGSGHHSLKLAQALLQFRDQQKASGSLLSTYWAVFDQEPVMSEEEFETKLWRELSYMTSFSEVDTTWDPHFSSNPQDKNFCFSLGGDAFYVLGLHPGSSRLARRFYRPALIFNMYAQFRTLMEHNDFKPMVKINRQREFKFQGDLNPMVELYGESWESIQFSGRENSSDWKCPFQHGLKPEAQND